MAMNPMQLMQLGNRFKIFNSQHPKVVPFFQKAARDGVQAGSVLEIKLTSPEGTESVCNIRVTEDDLETIEVLKNMQA